MLVEAGDVFETCRGYYDGSTDYYVTFKCPECGVLTDIPETDVPSNVRERIRSELAESNWDATVVSDLIDELLDLVELGVGHT